MIDKIYNLWNRRPVSVSYKYLASKGKEDRPLANNLADY